MRKWNRILAAVTAGVLCAVSVPWTVSAAEAGDTGTYGDLSYTVLEDGTVEITECDEAVTEVEIPAEINGMAVTSIGDCAFSYCDALTSITIPDSVVSIGDYAFSSCDALSEVVLSKYLDDVGESIFDYTPWLEAKIEENPLVIVNGIVLDGQDCTGDLVIPDGARIIARGVFRNSEIQTVTIPDSVVKIDEDAFYCCSELTKMIVGSGVALWDGSYQYFSGESKHMAEYQVSPDNQTFCSLDGVLYSKDMTILYDWPEAKSTSDVILPDSVEMAVDTAFDYCDLPNSITIGANLKTLSGIPNAAEKIDVSLDNMNFTSVDGVLFSKDQKILYKFPYEKTGNYTIPDGVVTIHDWSFYGSALSNVTIPSSVREIGCWAFCESDLTEAVIPEGVINIYLYAFALCKNLKKVSLPDSITVIGQEAFRECPLTSIVIPGGVETVPWQAFVYCPLEEVILEEGVKHIEMDAFGGDTPSVKKLVIPKSMELIDGAFGVCDGADVYYGGTEEDWSNIIIYGNTSATRPIGDDTYSLFEYANNVTIHFSETITETEPTDTMTSTTTQTTSTIEMTTTTEKNTITTNLSSSDSTVLSGDTNLDGRVDITDAVLLNKAAAGAVKFSDQAAANADCDANGELGTNDAIVLLKFLVHLVNTLPCTD